MLHVKKKVWDSCMSSALLYGCETWLTNNVKSVEKWYHASLKELLGVRSQTPNDLVLIETSLPTVKAFVGSRQKAFFHKLNTSEHLPESPVQFAIDLAKTTKSPMGNYITAIERKENNIKDLDIAQLKVKIHNCDSSRAKAYRELNKELEYH